MENTEEEINFINSGEIINDKNVNKENDTIFKGFKEIDYIENNDDILLEYYKSKHSSSENSYGTFEPLFKTKSEIIENSILNISDRYTCREKIYSKLLKNYTISDYNLNLSPLKNYCYTNDVIGSNKSLHSYSFKYLKDKTNHIFSYILKSSKKAKINKKYKEKSSDKKYIPTRNKINNEFDKGFDNGNINILDTLKIHLDNKTKEMIKSRNNDNIKIIKNEKHISHKNKVISNKKYNHHNENKTKLNLNPKKASINTKKVKKENIHLKNDEDLVKYIYNKIKQKNSYYIIELKNKSFIYKINKSKKIKTKEKDSLDINKIKEDNVKLRFKNIKLKKNFEQIEKELKLLRNKNKEIKNEIIKKEILIQKYEHKINEDKNRIQNLTKQLSEYTMNNNIKKFIFQKEIELFFINNSKTNKNHFNLHEIEKNIELNFEKEKYNKAIFFKNLLIAKVQELNLIVNKEKEKFNFAISNSQEINYIKIKQAEKDNNKIFEIIKINDIYFEKTKKYEIKSFNQNLSKENNFNFNFIKEKNIKIFESENLSVQTIEICQLLFLNTRKKILNLIISEPTILSILKTPRKMCNLVASEQTILSFIKVNKKIINLVISEHEILSFLKMPKKICNFVISEHIILSFLKKDIIQKNILKIMKLDFFSFDSINNINKFKNIEISKINISLHYQAKIENNNSENNKINNINNDNILIPNTDKIQLNNNEKNSKEKKEESNKNSEKSDKVNRAINRIRRKNQSIVPDSNLINSDENQELQKYRAKGRSDTVRVGRSGRILDIAKKLEMQMNNNEDNVNKKIETKKNENSNLVEIISTQPIIKNKKKKKKINFEFDN